ncbi:lysylphosphatidylglycerol synthase domain-containing protein [Bradyrhizobium sp. LHD-71]|uniref:lysylphosphatidylglycerol synthase domain-containing protein n=1 Tax=Bradyrhizobium sp. LHD-71 TaxID=3072141 RepID=UPI00280DB9C9|nr:lysylphosphatidylglycerol synthase domain-containing protein [Bradyrhizobium sp. LHD-71]MDQ8732133.1 lysylphosphatidylglycerol synthase domain-containing protein [Bradyrhizobium sp. LHD-71]
MRRARGGRWVGPLMAVIVVGLVGILGYRIVNEYRWADVSQAIAAVPTGRIVVGALFAAASYLCLSFFDWIALRCVGRPLAWRRAALASFCSLSIGHNVGFAGLSSGAVRYRFYARWGLSFEQVARLVIFCGLTVAMGLLTVGGCSLVFNPSVGGSFAGLSSPAARALGLLLLAVPVVYVGLTRFMTSVSLLGWTVPLPSTRLAAAQVGVGSLNYLCVVACLHQLVAGAGAIGYFDVATAYVLANTGVIASHVPGGIGVLESIVLSLLPGAPVLAALLIFRVVYYLVPLAFGLALLVLSEVLLKPGPDRQVDAATKPSLQKP